MHFKQGLGLSAGSCLHVLFVLSYPEKRNQERTVSKKIESFWDKDVQLHYDVRVAVGLIGGQTLEQSLNEMRSIRRYCRLPFPDKPGSYYLHRYAEYIRKKINDNQKDNNTDYIHPDCVAMADAPHGRILVETLMGIKKIIASVIQRDFDRDPVLFHTALERALKSTHGEYLAKRSLSSIIKMQTFKIKDADAGFALTTKKGSSELEAVSLYNQSGIPGLGTKLMIAAMEFHPRTLECFGPYLNDYYASHRFEVYKKIENVKMRNGTFQSVYCMKPNSNLYRDDIEKIRLQNIPKEQRTFELCYNAVKIDKMQLKFVPENHKTEELIKTIRHHNGILKYTPFALKTYENCLDAVTRNACNIKYVPRKFKTVELCLAAIQNNANVYLKHIPKRIVSYQSAVTINSWVFIDIPDELKTEEMCWKAVKDNKYLFQYVPQSLMTKELWMYAIEDYEQNINYLPEHIIKEYDLLHSYVKNGELHSLVLGEYPDDRKNQQIPRKS